MKNTYILRHGGFDSDEVWITDCNLDETGRFEVDPFEYYIKQIKRF